MSVYKVEYELSEDERKHRRFYRALSKSAAISMFEETVDSGSLTGYSPENVEVIKCSDSMPEEGE